MRNGLWIRVDLAVWGEVREILTALGRWQRAWAMVDLQWHEQQVRAGNAARMPARRDLQTAWNWGSSAVTTLINRRDRWADPHYRNDPQPWAKVRPGPTRKARARKQPSPEPAGPKPSEPRPEPESPVPSPSGSPKTPTPTTSASEPNQTRTRPEPDPNQERTKRTRLNVINGGRSNQTRTRPEPGLNQTRTNETGKCGLDGQYPPSYNYNSHLHQQSTPLDPPVDTGGRGRDDHDQEHHLVDDDLGLDLDDPRSLDAAPVHRRQLASLRAAGVDSVDELLGVSGVWLRRQVPGIGSRAVQSIERWLWTTYERTLAEAEIETEPPGVSLARSAWEAGYSQIAGDVRYPWRPHDVDHLAEIARVADLSTPGGEQRLQTAVELYLYAQRCGSTVPQLPAGPDVRAFARTIGRWLSAAATRQQQQARSSWDEYESI